MDALVNVDGVPERLVDNELPLEVRDDVCGTSLVAVVVDDDTDGLRLVLVVSDFDQVLEALLHDVLSECVLESDVELLVVL